QGQMVILVAQEVFREVELAAREPAGSGHAVAIFQDAFRVVVAHHLEIVPDRLPEGFLMSHAPAVQRLVGAGHVGIKPLQILNETAEVAGGDILGAGPPENGVHRYPSCIAPLGLVSGTRHAGPEPPWSGTRVVVVVKSRGRCR